MGSVMASSGEAAVRQMKALVQNPRRDPLFGSRQP
jgi:hypothetical protein